MSMQVAKLEHIITFQSKLETAMQEEWKNKSFTFEKPFIKVNPYFVAPLTALIYFTTQAEQSVSIRVKGKEKEGDFYFDFPKAKEHVIPVYGLYADASTEIVLTLGDGSIQTFTIATEKEPENLHKPTKIETSAQYMGQNVIFLSPTSAGVLAAYDYKGDVRWYNTLNLVFDLKRAKNGRILVGTHRFRLPPYHTTGLFEMGMIGKIYREYRLAGGYHHDQFEMEDGNLLILTQTPERGTVEDVCVLVDRKTGTIIKEWDYQKVLPQNVGGSGSQDEHDWFHNNSVWYDKKTNSITLSGRHQDIIINLDFDSGDLNWIIGDPECWPENMQKYFFKPVGDLTKFDWQYEQHAAAMLPNGDVMCFDNGHFRAKVEEKYVPAINNFSRGVRYKIDTNKMEIEQTWQFGKERGSDFFSTYISNIEYYADEHYMVHSGGIGKFKGEVCDVAPARYVGDDEQYLDLNSITIEIKDDVIVYEMHIPANYYRAEKLELYSKDDVLTFGKGELLGSLGITEQFDTIPETENRGLVPTQYKAKLTQEEDRLIFNGSFEKGQLVMLLLEGKKTAAYFIPTTKNAFLAMCVGTFLTADERAVEFPISCLGLSGEYSVKIIIDDAKYDTATNITI